MGLFSLCVDALQGEDALVRCGRVGPSSLVFILAAVEGEDPKNEILASLVLDI